MVSDHKDLERVRVRWPGGIREGFKSWDNIRQTWRFLVGRALRLHLQRVVRPEELEQHSKIIYFCGVLALGQTVHHVQLLQ